LAKLAGPTLAAVVVVWAGFRVDVLILPPSYQVSLCWLAIPVTVVWLVGVSNALNLVDGLDGLAGGVGVIALLTATAAAVAVGNNSVPWYTLALGGALLGFLRYNFPPAKVFLGDSKPGRWLPARCAYGERCDAARSGDLRDRSHLRSVIPAARPGDRDE